MLRFKHLLELFCIAGFLQSAGFVAAQSTPLVFSYVSHESCISGPVGTFTPDGDILFPSSMGFSQVAGTISFDPATRTAIDTFESMFQFQPWFIGEPGVQQGIYPVRRYVGQCPYNVQLTGGSSFTLEVAEPGCTIQGLSGPDLNQTIVISGGRGKGQFGPNLETYNGHSLDFVIERGSSTDGSTWERICQRSATGVRVPAR